MDFRSYLIDKYYWNCPDKGKKLPLIGGIIRRYYKKKIKSYGSYIGDPTCFAEKPILPHGLKGILVSHKAKIGKNCTIFHQVTIGSNELEDSKGYGAPTIGDDCLIGAGAKIIGNVHIGNNCRLGANVVITQDIPDNSTVVCERPRIIIRNTKEV